MNILIVDDFSTMRRIVGNLLRESGFDNTAEADDRLTARPMFRPGKCDFLATAAARREQIFIAAEAGIDGYVADSFTAATLKEKIQKIPGASATASGRG